MTAAPDLVPGFDPVSVERAGRLGRLRLPRLPHRGRLGEVRSASVGSSLELHDFRPYAPGDDVRQIDWNAAARLDELYVRVRQAEVSPRVEVLIDGSASMAISGRKSARTRELAAWLCVLAERARAAPVAVMADGTGEQHSGSELTTWLSRRRLEGTEPFERAMGRAAPLRPCGVRLVLSDFLFEAPPEPLVGRWARGAAALHLIQVVDPDDLEPPRGVGAKLIDAETGQTLERWLSDEVVAGYQQRLGSHLRLWESAARRAGASWLQANAALDVEALARGPLQSLLERT